MSEIQPSVTWSGNVWIISSILLPTLTFAISYPLAAWEGRIPTRGGAYFPSDSINEWPDRVIGTFGLGFTAWSLFHLFYYHYLFLSQMLPKWRMTTRGLLYLGELCAIFVFGVGAIQTGKSPFWHSLCAYGAFIGLNIYVSISTWLIDGVIDQKYPNYTRGKIRILSAIGSPVMFFLHLSPLTYGFTCSLAEIGLLVCFLVWVASQYNVWGKAHIVYETRCTDLDESTISSIFKQKSP